MPYAAYIIINLYNYSGLHGFSRFLCTNNHTFTELWPEMNQCYTEVSD